MQEANFKTLCAYYIFQRTCSELRDRSIRLVDGCSLVPLIHLVFVDAMYGLRGAFGIHQPFFGKREAVRLPDEFFYRTRLIFNPGPTFLPLFEYPVVPNLREVLFKEMVLLHRMHIILFQGKKIAASPSKPDADLPKFPSDFQCE
ncbi:hypothetical protein TNIN_309631 [Trichonephila inaurata madagascariensis]|uniref:Uncharacterized protein n=1 Tax=Trichonephila inaurata madagascariensis TaxID=2747483 RepID=A0A8X6XFF8_9ARAC|nr:hypothetical protein TNIN_309631 [Trichonephila inaurata madagascariensis]